MSLRHHNNDVIGISQRRQLPTGTFSAVPGEGNAAQRYKAPTFPEGSFDRPYNNYDLPDAANVSIANFTENRYSGEAILVEPGLTDYKSIRWIVHFTSRATVVRLHGVYRSLLKSGLAPN